jgi:uncharacterized membrane protein YccC
MTKTGVPTTGQPPEVSRRGVFNAFLEELAPSSIWLRNSVRTGVGAAVAVVVARSLEVPYAFWVVLGTLSALRSNVSASRRKALLALGGTALGVLIAVPFVALTGPRTPECCGSRCHCWYFWRHTHPPR